MSCYDYNVGCRQCGGYKIVENHRTGDVTCTDCGLVLMDRFVVDEFHHQNYEPFYHKNMDLLACCNHLHLPESIEKEACSLLLQIKDRRSFRGTPNKAVIACCVYITCIKQGCSGVARSAPEIYDAFGLDGHAFNKALKIIYDIFPIMSQVCMPVTENDSIIRQLRQLDLPNECVWKLARLVRQHDDERAHHNLMLGSPPLVINAVLIYMAMEDLSINTVKKAEYVKVMCISRATLDKYTKLLRT
jgi:transcription initiation factor TFIIIB Brf1 subunit/transcription initiation factor TFIIB